MFGKMPYIALGWVMSTYVGTPIKKLIWFCVGFGVGSLITSAMFMLAKSQWMQ
jgi:hypothetical protein